MGSIRPLELEDLPGVVRLFERAMGPGTGGVRSGVEPFFRRLFLDCPWADGEIPALVYDTGDGTIGGFLGSQVRRMIVDGRPIRCGVSGPLFSDPQLRSKGVGGLLLYRYFTGPQDLTLTDGAGPDVRTLWERLGGVAVSLSCLTWNRFFRPAELAVDCLLPRDRSGMGNRVARAPGALLDRLLAITPPWRAVVGEPDTTVEELTPRVLVEHLPEIAAKRRVRPDYDETYLTWLFDTLNAPINQRVFRRLQGPTPGGCLAARLVRDRAGRALGWYVAYMQRGGIAEVQQLAARDGQMEAVVSHLFADAWKAGATLLRGRLEAGVCEPVWKRRCTIRHAARLLVHSRHSAVLSAVLSGDTLLTMLDGDRWIGLHVEAMT